MVNIIKNSVNSIIGFVNNMVSKITSSVNKAIDLINKIPAVNIKNIDTLRVGQKSIV
jgi:phage-related protein